MGRFDGASGKPLPLDTYATRQFKTDVSALTEPVHGFFDSLAAMLAAGKTTRNGK
jgi:hypothetical protein